MRLKEKKALITGAYRGIGKETAELFLAEGAEVWGLDYMTPEDLTDRTNAANGKFHWITADLSNLDSVDGIIENAVKDSGGFDILVNNAGITRDKLSFRMTAEDWQKVIDINLSAAFLAARTVGRDMIRRRKGSIINMSSVVGIHGNAGQANYSASKAGLIGVTKSLALETGGRGVRVNAVAPGFIATDMTAGLPVNIKEMMLEKIPLGRMGTVRDISLAILFLASDDSAYITGQVLPVDGGMFL